MFFINLVLALVGALLLLGPFANRKRAKALHHDFELQPNCLLSRWPLVFIGGSQSYFYSGKYWNFYPIYLAEHGYEVFHLNLPWRSKNICTVKFNEFLQERLSTGKPVHLFMDRVSYKHLEQNTNLNSSPSIASVTILTDKEIKSHRLSPTRIPHVDIAMEEKIPSSFILRSAFKLHKLIRQDSPTLSCLGACKETQLENANKILQRAQTLAESDLAN